MSMRWGHFLSSGCLLDVSRLCQVDKKKNSAQRESEKKNCTNHKFIKLEERLETIQPVIFIENHEACGVYMTYSVPRVLNSTAISRVSGCNSPFHALPSFFFSCRGGGEEITSIASRNWTRKFKYIAKSFSPYFKTIK